MVCSLLLNYNGKWFGDVSSSTTSSLFTVLLQRYTIKQQQKHYTSNLLYVSSNLYTTTLARCFLLWPRSEVVGSVRP